MKYLKFTHVDSLTKVSVHTETALNGPVVPEIEGLVFGFALASLYPTDKPVFYGTAPDDVDLNAPGILDEVSEDDFNQAKAAEEAAQKALTEAQILPAIAGTRKTHETAGFLWGELFIDTSAASYAKIIGNRAAAKDGLRKDTDVWQCLDQATGTIIFRPTTNEEMIEIGDRAWEYVQKCFNREGELIDAFNAGTFTYDMLAEGWPA